MSEPTLVNWVVDSETTQPRRVYPILSPTFWEELKALIPILAPILFFAALVLYRDHFAK